MVLSQIRKRSGQLVPFDSARIQQAIAKAWVASGLTIDEPKVAAVTDAVVAQLHADFDGTDALPTVEQIQDAVEKQLTQSGSYEVAKNYILYRADHERLRAEERLRKIEEHMLKVRLPNGKTEIFDVKRVRATVEAVAAEFPAVNTELVVSQLQQNVYDGITPPEISRALVMVAKSFIERDPEYSYFAAKLLLKATYAEVFPKAFTPEDFHEAYGHALRHNLIRGVEAGRINSELLSYDLKKLSKALKPERDHLLTYLGAQTLFDRYFIHIEDERIEAPQTFWMRVAMGLALAEDKADREAYTLKFYDLLSSLRFVSSTPTLFNSGTTHSQLSSCYLSTVKDSLDHIFKVIGDNAQLSKWAGGIGNDWTSIRSTGARIHGTNGRSQGVIPFLKIANDTAVAVNQGGKRKGAVVAYLENWHYDIEEFLELRRNTGDERRRTHDMNTAVWIPDLFMKRLLAKEHWTLFSPDEVGDLHDTYGKQFEAKYLEYEALAEKGKIKLHKRIKAADLWRKMVTMLFETGHPWMTFKDPCNLRSPQDHCGVVHNSNLCTEITLNNSREETAVCNLGSVNLGRHFDPSTGEVNWDLMKETVSTGMRMLDNVIDINLYPTAETKTSNLRHRPVGMGVMGLQDLIYKYGAAFDSDHGVKISDNVMEFVSYHALLSSSHLAKERGSYQSYKGSKWDRGLLPIDTIDLLQSERGVDIPHDRTAALDWAPVRQHIAAHGMRNSNCLAIAPTATISNISGCIPCVEPIYKNLYVKSNMGGEFTIINTYLVDELKSMGLWGEEMLKQLKIHDGSIQAIEQIPDSLKLKYKEVFEINAQWFIRHAAARGKWIDQAQSINIFYRGTSGKDISDIYQYAWRMGLKTTYYLRTLGASQVEKATISDSSVNTQARDFSKPAAPTQTEADKATMCSILNGPDCEACQ